MSSQFVHGLGRMILYTRAGLHILWMALAMYRRPFRAYRAFRNILKVQQSIYGSPSHQRFVYAAGKYYFSPHVPGWPSSAFRMYIANALNEVSTLRPDSGYLQTLVLTITNRCPMRCQHCFESEDISTRESLTLDELRTILHRFQSRGVSHVQFSGGEPLCRLADLIELIRTARRNTEFWILTSGYGMTEDAAAKLKKAGLTGVNLSLDHWDPKEHNRFRNCPEAYHWVEQAASNSHRENLVLALSLCAVREFITLENLWKYLHHAGELGAGFVRIIEPRRIGRYSGKDVELGNRELAILNEFYQTSRMDTKYKDLPLVIYPGFHQRSSGCSCAGDRLLFVDSRGDIHSCPFCRQPAGSALTDSIDDAIRILRRTGCHRFEMRRPV